MPHHYKRSYHPYIPLAFHLSLLSEDSLKQVPRSTKRYWKSKKTAALFGFELCPQQQDLLNTLSLIAQNKHLMAINKALLYVIAIKKFIQRHLYAIKNSRPAIIRTLIHNVQKIVPGLGLTKSLKLIQLSYAQWNRISQTKDCTKSYLRLCRRKHPSQLLSREIKVIEKCCSDPLFTAWPLSSIYHHLIRKELLYCSLPSFYKYASLFVQQRLAPTHKRKHHHIGIRAMAPMQIIHADITEFRTSDHTKAYIFFIQDNFSRAILKYTVATNKKAGHLIDLLKDILQQRTSTEQQKITMITDDGSENKNLTSHFSNNGDNLLHLIAQKDIIFSNSMIEYLHRTIKYRYLYRQSIENLNQLASALHAAVKNYNNRPAHVLGGLTPLEVLNGISPETAQIKQKIKAATLTRLLINKNEGCCL